MANPRASVKASRRGEIPCRSHPAALRSSDLNVLRNLSTTTPYTIKQALWFSYGPFVGFFMNLL
jgi:hypothetical protein